MIFRVTIVASLIIFIGSCINPPSYSPIPAIVFDSVSGTFARAQTDSLTFFINFTDGDGDLGSTDVPNLFFLDSRTGYVDSFKIPSLTPQGNVKAITGVIAYTRSEFNCIPNKDFDTLHYSIYIEDRAGNKSNVVTTPSIILQCH
ncbi:MAG: hypothetical protein ACHQD9_04570 [Chitinophagales bacterium]